MKNIQNLINFKYQETLIPDFSITFHKNFYEDNYNDVLKKDIQNKAVKYILNECIKNYQLISSEMILSKIKNHKIKYSFIPNDEHTFNDSTTGTFDKYKYVIISENLIDDIIKKDYLKDHFLRDSHVITLKKDNFLIFMNHVDVYFKELDHPPSPKVYKPLHFIFSFKQCLQPICYKVDSKKYYRLKKLKTLK